MSRYYYDRTIHQPKPKRHWSRPSASLALAVIIALSSGIGVSRAMVGPQLNTSDVPALIITAVQTGGCNDDLPTCSDKAPASEFVEVYNPSDKALTLEGWKLRYVTATSSASSTDLATISGTIPHHRYMLFAHAGPFMSDAPFMNFGSETDSGKLAESAGIVEITDTAGKTVDRFSWGKQAKPTDNPSTASLKPGQVAVRRSNEVGQLVFGNNNATDFMLQNKGGYDFNQQPRDFTPTTLATPFPDETTPAETEPATPQTPDADDTTPCRAEAIIISELLPNPAGSDTGQEFIELHNPSDKPVSLQYCQLQTSANATKKYTFDAVTMQPGEYLSLTDATLGLTLPNAAGGTVQFNSTTSSLQSVTYPADLDDDAAWALLPGGWVKSYTPTPGKPNVETPLRPCDTAGEVRSAETGRCAVPAQPANTTAQNPAMTNPTMTATTTTTAAPCKAGQERNPSTGRCRNVTATAASSAGTPAACKAGQERNPDTGRCRNVATAAKSGASKACPTGQERNPETNRCRKAAAAGSTKGTGSGTGVHDVASTTPAGQPHAQYWLIGGVVGVAIIGYAIYEWRQEISEFFRRRWSRMAQPTAKPALGR